MIFFVYALEYVLNLLLDGADAVGIMAYLVVNKSVGAFLFLCVFLLFFKKEEDERHTHIFAVKCLIEIFRAGILINRN